jgi:hypothetical protein
MEPPSVQAGKVLAAGNSATYWPSGKPDCYKGTGQPRLLARHENPKKIFLSKNSRQKG